MNINFMNVEQKNEQEICDPISVTTLFKLKGNEQLFDASELCRIRDKDMGFESSTKDYIYIASTKDGESDGYDAKFDDLVLAYKVYLKANSGPVTAGPSMSYEPYTNKISFIFSGSMRYEILSQVDKVREYDIKVKESKRRE